MGSAFNVAWLNIGIPLLAELIIFPAVFALGFTPDQDPELVFIVLPAVFHQIPFGCIFYCILGSIAIPY